MNSKEWYSKNQANFSIGEDTQTLAETRQNNNLFDNTLLINLKNYLCEN
jgi:hypothetical protein